MKMDRFERARHDRPDHTRPAERGDPMSTIPDDLMARFRDANDNFHLARLRLDNVGDVGMEERREIASAVRTAEREVVAVTDEISRLLSQLGRPGQGGSHAGQ
jgi:hypothetical protein